MFFGYDLHADKERGFCMWGLMLIAVLGMTVAGIDKMLVKKDRKQGMQMVGGAFIIFLLVVIFAPSDDNKKEEQSVEKDDKSQKEVLAENITPSVEKEVEEEYDPDDYTKYWTEFFSANQGLRYNMSYVVSENYGDGNENFNWFYENNTERTANVVIASRVDAPSKGFDVEAYSKNGGSFLLDIDGYYDVIIFYDDDTVERIPLTDFILKE